MSALFRYALSLGDDSLILGQRLCALCGHAPELEIDLSVSNIALDLIGQGTYFLTYAGEVEGKGRDADKLAFHRDALDFTNVLLVEQPNGDFGHIVARQFYFSTWQRLLLGSLTLSSDETLAAIAEKAVKEVAYHEDFAAGWIVRLGDGTEESHRRITDGLTWMSRFIDDLFFADEAEVSLAAAGIAVDKRALRPQFDQRIAETLAKAGLDTPMPHRAMVGGRRGYHSEHLGHLLAEMQHLPRTYPDAAW